MSERLRVITRRISGYTWAQFCLADEWKWGSWWAVRGIAACHAYGPFRVLTMRVDAVDRAKRPGGEFARPAGGSDADELNRDEIGYEGDGE